MIPAHLATDQKNKQDSEASSRASWNTPRSDSRGRMSYGSRMALSFALTSLMTVLIMACVVSVVWSGAFSEYTRANITEIAQLTGLAQQTAYRYLQYLVSEDRVEVRQCYGKVGRPKQKYRLRDRASAR